MDFSGLEIVGNIWDPFSTQLNEIYHKELSFLVILVPKCYLKTKNMNSRSSNKCLLWKVWCWFFFNSLINNDKMTHDTLHSTFSAVSDMFIPWRWPRTEASVWTPLHRRSPCTRCSNHRRPRLRPLSSDLQEAGTKVKISTFTRTSSSVLCSLCAIHQPFWASHWSSRSSSSADRFTFFTLVICNTTSAAELHSTPVQLCVHVNSL